jgi:hypothetical protein
MGAVALLRQALTAGLSVTGDGKGGLHVVGPKRLTPLVQQLHQYKTAVLAVWELWAERAAIMEFDGGLPREDAEGLAWACVLAALPPAPGAVSTPLTPAQSASLPVGAGERGGQAAPGRAWLAEGTRA